MMLHKNLGSHRILASHEKSDFIKIYKVIKAYKLAIILNL